MRLRTQLWKDQNTRWPLRGRHILAQYDDERIWVYQAYRDEVADWAVEHQLGGPWGFDRMTWIKPNFLWMMYRSGWAAKPGQQRILAIALDRTALLLETPEEHVLPVADAAIVSRLGLAPRGGPSPGRR